MKDSGSEPDEFVEPESSADIASAKPVATKRSSPAAARRPSNQSQSPSLLDDSAPNADTDYVPGASTSRSSAGTSRQPPKKRRINATAASSTQEQDPFEFDEEHTSPKRTERERDVSDEEADDEMLTNGAPEAAPPATTTTSTTTTRRGRGSRGRGASAAAAHAAAATTASDDRRSTSPTAAANARSSGAVSSVKRATPATSSLAAAMAKSQSQSQSAAQSQSAQGRSRLSPTTSFLMSASAQSGAAAKAKRAAAAAGALADIRTTQSGTIMIDDYLAANRPLAFIFDNTNALSLAILARLATQLKGHPILAYPCKPVSGHKSAAATSISASNAGHSKSDAKEQLLNGEAVAGDAEKKEKKEKEKEKKESDKEAGESAAQMDTDVASASAGTPAATQDIDTSKQSSQQDSYTTPAASSARSTPATAAAAAGTNGAPSLAEAIGSSDLGDFFRAHNVDAVDDLGLLFQKSELVFVSCPDASFLESVCTHCSELRALLYSTLQPANFAHFSIRERFYVHTPKDGYAAVTRFRKYSTIKLCSIELLADWRMIRYFKNTNLRRSLFT